MSHAKFASAFLEEFDTLCDLMEKDGAADPDFTSEKRAAFGFIMANIDDDEDYAYLDKLADAELSSFEKVAIRGALGRFLLRRGAGMTERGGRMLEKAYKPTRAFTERFTRKGWSPERIQSVFRSYKTMGPRGWMRMRRAVAPAFAGPSAARAAAPGAAHPISRMKWTGLEKLKGHTDPTMRYMAGAEVRRRAAREAARKGKKVGKTTRQRAAAGARKGKGKAKPDLPLAAAAEGAEKGWWPSIKSGLLWGGGFGLAQRALAPAEEPEYVLGQ